MAERGNSGGLAYESVRTSVSAVRTLTSGKQHRQVRQANKTVGLKRPTDISFGWVAERSNAAVLKTVVGASPPGVRIPPHPPGIKKAPQTGCFFILLRWADENAWGSKTSRQDKYNAVEPLRFPRRQKS